MALRMQTRVTAQAPKASRSAVIVRAQQSESRSAGIAIATIATAVLLGAGSAHAGVQYAKPERKKAFYDDGSAPAAVKKAPVVTGAPIIPTAAPAPAVKSESAPSEPFSFSAPNISALYVPLAIGGIGAAGFAASKLDDTFGEFMDNALLRKSDVIGAGYENTIKADGGFIAPKGTKTIKAGSSSNKKFGFF